MGFVFIGIDLSLKSPGLAIYNVKKKIIKCYFFPQRKRETGITIDHTIGLRILGKNEKIKFQISPFPNGHIPQHCLITKYKTISENIIQAIDSETIGIDKHCVRITLEGYAFNARSSSSSKLHELGGILKYLLHYNKYEFREIAPTKLKKTFSGKGNADKELMYYTFLKTGFPDLLDPFGFVNCKGIPNPIQDIVDAIAIILSFFSQSNKSNEKYMRN